MSFSTSTTTYQPFLGFCNISSTSKMFSSGNNFNIDPPPNYYNSFFHIPSPLLHYDDFDLEEEYAIFDTLLQVPRSSMEPHNDNEVDVLSKQEEEEEEEEKTATTAAAAAGGAKKKSSSSPSSGKKDRHSKITTAQGPRDRRMRLSLKVAREFFDLQDNLGFDKASKTVDWLLTQAKSEIKKIESDLNLPNTTTHFSCSTGSSACECEVVSPIKEENTVKKGRQPKKNTYNSPPTKESREKARERARERTRKKQCDEVSSNTYANSSSMEVRIPNEDIMRMEKWNPCSPNFSYQGPQENEFQNFSKTWDAYNNLNLYY